MIKLSGIPVYKGIEIAPIFIYEEELKITKASIGAEEVEDTIVRFNSILKTAATQEIKTLLHKEIEKYDYS